MRFATIFLFVSSALFMTSCAYGRKDPSFDISATINQHSTDPDKGIHLVIYPVDRAGEK